MYNNTIRIDKYKMKNEVNRETINETINLIRCKMRYGVFFFIVGLILTLSGMADAQVKLKAKVPDLCFECHKELKKAQSDKYVHFLFKDGKCVTCHDPSALDAMTA
ncbi:MAG: hypothetical protein HZC49_12805 [Nitrospirae bacterium]|nr:hypothetical protein [Nitrospirota bacterium]